MPPKKLSKKKAEILLEALAAQIPEEDALQKILTVYAEDARIDATKEAVTGHLAGLQDPTERLGWLRSRLQEEDTSEDDDVSEFLELIELQPPKKKKRCEASISDLVEHLKGGSIAQKKKISFDGRLKILAQLDESFEVFNPATAVQKLRDENRDVVVQNWKSGLSDFMMTHGLDPQSASLRTPLYITRDEYVAWLKTVHPEDYQQCDKETWFLPFSIIGRLLSFLAMTVGGMALHDTLAAKFRTSWTTGFVDFNELCTSITNHKQGKRFQRGRPQNTTLQQNDQTDPKNEARTRKCFKCHKEVVGPFRNHKC